MEAILKEDLQASRELNHKLDAQVKDKEELVVEKALIFELKTKLAKANSRRVATEVQVEKLKIKVKADRLVVNKVVAEYKGFEDFKAEVAEGCLESFHFNFLECKRKLPRCTRMWI